MKKLTSLIFIISLLTLSFSTVYADEFVAKVPKLIFVDIETMPTVNADETLSLNLTLENDSAHTAKKITITPNFEDLPITWERATDYTTLYGLTANKQTKVTFDFKVSPDAKPGTYGLKFDFDFYNGRGENFKSNQTIYFKVEKAKVRPILNINQVKTTPDLVEAGKNVDLAFRVSNMGELPAKDLTVTLSGLSKDGFMAMDSSDFRYVTELNGGSSIDVLFHLLVSEDIIKGPNSIAVKLEYTDAMGEKVSEEKSIYINDVKSKNESTDDDSKEKPKVMIESYSTNPYSIRAGDSISFTFKFINTSSTKAIKNVKVVVSSSDGAFMIAKGSNTFYIENLEPKGEIEQTIDLNVKQDLTSKSYPVSINFDYEDSSNTSFTSEEVISLPVTEYSKLVINSVYVGGDVFVNGTTNLSFDYINMGKATVSNLRATVEGDYTSKQPINYIGNLEAGNSDYYDIEIIPTKAGEINGTLVLTFEDSSGKEIEVRKAFQGMAMEEFVPGQDGEDPSNPGNIDIPTPPADTSKPLGVGAIAGIGFGSFVVSLLVTKFIAVRIIRKKLEDEI